MKKAKQRQPNIKKNPSEQVVDLTYFLAHFGEAMLIRVGHGGERVFFGKSKKS